MGHSVLTIQRFSEFQAGYIHVIVQTIFPFFSCVSVTAVFSLPIIIYDLNCKPNQTNDMDNAILYHILIDYVTCSLMIL